MSKIKYLIKITVKNIISSSYLYASLPVTDGLHNDKPLLAPQSIMTSIVAKARLELASHYANPDGQNYNIAKAIKWFEKAGDLGSTYGLAQAAKLIITNLESPDDLEKARLLFKAAATTKSKIDILPEFCLQNYDKPTPEFMAHLNLVFKLKSLQQYKYLTAIKFIDLGQYDRAVSLFNQILAMENYAHIQGYEDTKFQLGLLHLSGLGVEKNINKAKQFFIQAADEGHLEAMQIIKGL